MDDENTRVVKKKRAEVGGEAEKRECEGNEEDDGQETEEGQDDGEEEDDV